MTISFPGLKKRAERFVSLDHKRNVESDELSAIVKRVHLF